MANITFEEAQELCPYIDGPIVSNGKGLFVGSWFGDDGDRMRIEYNTNPHIPSRKHAYYLSTKGRFIAWEQAPDKTMRPMAF